MKTYFIKKWRAIAMLKYIKANIHRSNILEIIDKYIDFTKTVEEELETEQNEPRQQRTNTAITE
jgi:hypothetical protein